MNLWERASALIGSLPIVHEIASFYDGPDISSAISRKAWEDGAVELRSLANSAANGERDYLFAWLSDIHVAVGNIEEGLRVLPRPTLSQRRSMRSDKVLAMKLEIGAAVDSTDVIGLFGPTFTKFGRDNAKSVAAYLDVQLSEAQKHTNLIAEWARDAHELEHGYTLFSGHPSYLITKPPRGLYFSLSPQAEAFCGKIIRDAENTWREEQGIPRVGEGWVSETKLFYAIKSALPDLKVVQHGRPKWLGRQHLDIFLPELAVAIEYQGSQHDTPVAFFGGEKAFLETQKRDKRKLNLCQRHGVRLIYAREGYDLSELLASITDPK